MRLRLNGEGSLLGNFEATFIAIYLRVPLQQLFEWFLGRVGNLRRLTNGEWMKIAGQQFRNNLIPILQLRPSFKNSTKGSYGLRQPAIRTVKDLKLGSRNFFVWKVANVTSTKIKCAARGALENTVVGIHFDPVPEHGKLLNHHYDWRCGAKVLATWFHLAWECAANAKLGKLVNLTNKYAKDAEANWDTQNCCWARGISSRAMLPKRDLKKCDLCCYLGDG